MSSHAPSHVPSRALSCAPSVAPLPEGPSAQPTLGDPTCDSVPLGLPQLEVLSNAPGGQEEEEYRSDVEERDMEFLDTEEGLMEKAKDKSKIRGWEELREQIKEDLQMSKDQNMTLTQINQLIILRNFATLLLKGSKRIVASEHIADQ